MCLSVGTGQVNRRLQGDLSIICCIWIGERGGLDVADPPLSVTMPTTASPDASFTGSSMLIFEGSKTSRDPTLPFVICKQPRVSDWT